nr:MAG TPA: hypothetical protein [Caudoviricetes sp.]
MSDCNNLSTIDVQYLIYAKVHKVLRIRCISVCIKFVLFLYFFCFSY